MEQRGTYLELLEEIDNWDFWDENGLVIYQEMTEAEERI